MKKLILLFLTMTLIDTLSINNGNTTIFKVFDSDSNKIIYVATSLAYGGQTTALGVIKNENTK